ALAREVYLLLRLVPAAQSSSASLRDPSAPAPLRAELSSYSVDASAGAAVRLTPEASRVGFWILGDGGYGWAPRPDLGLRPALADSDHNKAGATSLGSIDTRGLFMRLWMAITL